MADGDVERWVKEGITAVKSGDRVRARSLFLKVVKADDQNESAWLWLSSVVEKEEDKRVCLENVLAINPDNAPAWRRLNALDNPVEQPAPSSANGPVIEFRHEEQFDDVWSRDLDICGYCAGVVKLDAKRCPSCKRNLLVKVYRYATPTTNITAVWIGLVGLALLYALQVGYSSIYDQNPITVIFGIIFMLMLLGTAVGIFFRKFWAYVLTITTLSLVIFLGIVEFFIVVDITPFEYTNLDPFFRNILESVTNAIWIGLKVVQMIVAAITLVFAFRASGDFERAQYRQIATPTKGLKRAMEYHQAARRLADVGLWATAVKNWQRAVALEPHRVTFQIQLGQAYAHLGFIERSLDVLQSARTRTRNVDVQAEIDQEINAVQQKQLKTAGKA